MKKIIEYADVEGAHYACDELLVYVESIVQEFSSLKPNAHTKKQIDFLDQFSKGFYNALAKGGFSQEVLFAFESVRQPDSFINILPDDYLKNNPDFSVHGLVYDLSNSIWICAYLPGDTNGGPNTLLVNPGDATKKQLDQSRQGVITTRDVYFGEHDFEEVAQKIRLAMRAEFKAACERLNTSSVPAPEAPPIPTDPNDADESSGSQSVNYIREVDAIKKYVQYWKSRGRDANNGQAKGAFRRAKSHEITIYREEGRTPRYDEREVNEWIRNDPPLKKLDDLSDDFDIE